MVLDAYVHRHLGLGQGVLNEGLGDDNPLVNVVDK